MRRAALLFLSLALVLAGCTKGNFSGNEKVAGNVLRYAIPTTPTTMDPGKVEDGDTIDLLQQTYEGLVGWNEQSTVAPRIAKSWDVSKDGKTYTFHLRDDVKFSNGRPVTAQDFKWCFERNSDPDFPTTTSRTYLSDIVGVNDKLDRKANDVKGVQAVDDHTLTIAIQQPSQYFVDKLTYPVAFVFAKEALKDPKKEMSAVDEMIGTGPFKMKQYDHDQSVTLVRNDLYYGGKPKLDGIYRPIVADAATRLAMYKQGEVDLVALERQDAVGLRSDPEYGKQLQFFPRPSLWYIGLNCNMIPQLKDVRIRRAIAMAIDKDNIINNVLDGINDKADCIVPPKVFGHRDRANAIQYDPTAAKQLLAQAGYPDGKGFPELEMSYRENRPDIRIVASAVGQDLEKNLGIKVTFKAVEWGAYLALNDKSQIPFYHMRWAADFLDAENFLSTLLASYGPEDHVNYHNAQFDALCRKADSSLDTNERLKLYAQAEDIALQEAPFVPIYFQKDAELISPRVHGIRESVFGHLPHTTTYLQ